MPFLELFTKIDMVYRHLLFLYLKDIYVFVQKLLWFILDKLNDCLQNSKYSYKNCYGLSKKTILREEQIIKYSYKNCYGLSRLCWCVNCYSVKYSYKNCYGLSLVKSRFVISSIA